MRLLVAISELFTKSNCYICGEEDLKSNMDHANFGIYGADVAYFHVACVKAVICEPEAHEHNMVNRALWVEECLAQRAEDKRRREARIKQAQARLCN